MDEAFVTAEREVLVENTAQAVLKHLNRLEDTRAALGTRCIWELLQNARDAAGPSGVKVHISITDDELCFRHDGRPFKHKEVAHLIYHGTTKLDEEGDVGHFGSGFLSTHLLSRRVRVFGSLEGGARFDFWLDRTADDPDELSRAMRRSMDEWEQSSQMADGSAAADTEFRYPLDEQSMVLARSAIEDLRAWGPLVLALAPEFGGISVDSDENSWHLARGTPLELAGNPADVEVVTIEDPDRDDMIPHAIAVVRKSKDVQVALPLQPSPAGLRIDLDQRTPRIFVLFPLLGTDRLVLPTIAQSRGFEPLEERDGLVLDGDSPRAVRNRALLEQAVPLMTLLMDVVAHERWSGVEQLLSFDSSRLPEKIDRSWFVKLLRSLVEHARNSSLMPVVSGAWVTPSESWIPQSETELVRSKLWDLAIGWKDSSEKLPPQNTLPEWSRNLSNWARLLELPRDQLPEALTVGRLARMVSNAESVAGLDAQLEGTRDPLDWLAQFLRLVNESDETSLLDNLSLLPSQAGGLCERLKLSIDQGIDDDLKDIGAAFGVNLRRALLDARAAVPGIDALLGPKTEQQALDEILNAVRQQSQEGRLPSSLVSMSVDLFWWIASRDCYADRLDGFPVATSEESDDTCSVLEFNRSDRADHMPLAPVAAWPEGARAFAPLFPKRRVLNEAFAQGRNGAEAWTNLARLGYLHVGPLYETNLTLEDALSVESLSEEMEHESTQPIQMSCIACLKDKDTGLIDGARKSRSRAIQLVQFIFDHVLGRDERAFERVSVQCECATEHEVYRAAWLEPLRTRKWIPPEAAGHGADRVSAESLARLLIESPELVRRPESEPGKSLLLTLGISPADFALRVVAPDEDTRVSLIRSIGDLAQAAGGADQVRALVDQIQDDPGILKTIEERKQNRERVRRNQSIGRLVEELLREQLEERGLKVQRTGTGSDYEVESDFIENEQEVLLELGIERNSTLVEVKSARTDRVKMTPTQVRTACDKGSRFALCVVPVADDNPTGDTIREHSRFVFGVGDELAEAWAAYRGIETATDAAQQTHGAVELEIREQEVRFKIGSQLWSRGLSFTDAVTEFLKRGGIAGANPG